MYVKIADRLLWQLICWCRSYTIYIVLQYVKIADRLLLQLICWCRLYTIYIVLQYLICHVQKTKVLYGTFSLEKVFYHHSSQITSTVIESVWGISQWVITAFGVFETSNRRMKSDNWIPKLKGLETQCLRGYILID